MIVVAMMSSSARIEAFKAAGPARSALTARTRLSARAAAAMAEPISKDSSGGDQAKRALNGEDSRSFFERLGSPKYIAAPMVEHSEAVSYDKPPYTLTHVCLNRGAKIQGCKAYV